MKWTRYTLLAALFLALILAACGPSAPQYTEAMLTDGQKTFTGTCSACHGEEGKGLPNLGKDFTTSEFVREKTDQEMIDFLKVGRPSGDPLNTTGVDMPPKGGNPSLTDDQLLNVVAFVRSLQQ